MISKYRGRNILKLTASILFAINQEDYYQIYSNLNKIFDSIKTNDDKCDLSLALSLVKRYGKNSERLSDLIFENTLDSFIDNEEKIVKANNKKIRALRKDN